MRLWIYSFLVLLVLGISWEIAREESSYTEAAAPGLEVYLGEGCIHCHSQYRRPVGYDAQLWGPASDWELEMGRQHPVVFGNRRQGPDLSNVGLRRSRDWNRAHLMDPQEIRRQSRMPSYAHLFEEGDFRGEALLDYLQSLGDDSREEWTAFVEGWSPKEPLNTGAVNRGWELFKVNCAGCHGTSGRGDGPMASRFTPAPRNLRRPDAWQWISLDGDPQQRRLELARLLKFGRPGTSMAGTEWLTDQELADLIRFLETLSYAGEK